MSRISSLDTRNQRWLIVEGKLVAPWDAELETACKAARSGLEGRELVIEVKNLIAISQAGENVLLELMNQGARASLLRNLYEICVTPARTQKEHSSGCEHVNVT